MGKLSYRTLREKVEDTIRMKILTHELTPGTRIIEQNISEEFGVSRGPIREALRQLEQEGLIAYTRNIGCSVRNISLEDIYEIYLLRSSYEELAVKTYGGKFSEEDFLKMEEALGLMKRQKEADFGKLASYDSMFHKVIVEKAGFERILKAWSELNYGNLICFFAGNPNKEEAVKRQYSMHKNLLDVCKSGDKENICRAISEHYMKTIRRLIKEEGIDIDSLKWKI